MNRIEQVATPAPAQAQPRRSRVLTAVRRRTAQSLFQSGEAPARARRGTSGIAVAIAALTVPMLPSQAFGSAQPEAPQARHHLRHDQVYPGPGGLTVQGWTASGWTLTVPSRPDDTSLWARILTMRHDGYDVPWFVEPAGPIPDPITDPIDRPRPVVLPEGTRGEIAAYRVTHASPRADDPAPGGAVGAPPARVAPNPLITTGQPANTKQMMAAPRPVAGLAQQAAAASDPSESPCAHPGYLAGKDRSMPARLHRITDAMNVAAAQQPATCGVKVDHLSQARA